MNAVLNQNNAQVRVRLRLHSRWWAVPTLLVMLGAHAAHADEKPNSCVTCHSVLPDQLGAPVEGMKHDVHAEHGLSCADCHGGDPSDMDIAAMSPEKGYRGKPARAEIPDFCGRCHSDAAYMRQYNPSLPTNQRERYLTSVHGKRLAQGDQKVATCISCHGVHGIRDGRHAESPVYKANIPSTCGGCHSKPDYMAGYDIPTNQEAGYRQSVHGEMLLVKRDLSAPTCTTCHDNHGASPPGLTSIAAVCGQCHVNNAEFFVASPHKSAFDKASLPECVTCHGNHAIHRTSDAMLGTDKDGLCVRCHAPGSAGYAAAAEMRATIDTLKATMQTAASGLDRAEAMGMEVGDARYEFHAVDAMLIQTRTGVHRVSPAYVNEVAAPGLALAQRTEQTALAAQAEATTRRRNLLIPVAVIGVLMVLLWLKLRQMERGAAKE